MHIGDLVLGRFALQRLVGEGGSSKVYQAFDRGTGCAVALKVLSARSELDDQRFRAEARILSGLSHPGIVRYVAHGDTPTFESFIAMQWLDGETLAERLTRGPLTTSESVSIIRQVAEALSGAHDRGLVHRDLKPSNIFLVNCDPALVKVLDFGIAKFLAKTGERTETGTLLGTVGYMAPEQALAAREADARADIFALGCVLLECLTGRRAFEAQHAVAVLAKVLTAPAPRLSNLRPELRGPLDLLVEKMLSKERSDRPANASALLLELDALTLAAERPAASHSGSPPSSFTGLERRVVSILLVQSGNSNAERQTEGTMDQRLPRLESLAIQFGANVMLLSNGALLVVLSGRGNASDRANQAAVCGLALRRVEQDARIVLSTGWADATMAVPESPAIDRAAALLHSSRDDVDAFLSGIVLDTTTARLLASRFEIVETGSSAFVLTGEQGAHDPSPRLLGKATPCVGRDRELSLLRSALAECSADRVPRAVLVMAEAGVGKSRLAQEFIAFVQKEASARVLLARSDSTGAGAAFLLLRQLVRAAARLDESTTPKDAHAAFRARLEPVLDENDAALCAAFLCELVGTPVDAEPNSVLCAARGDARLMSDWTRRAFDEWFSIEASDPVVIVLEDLHWGDTPTVTYLGGALSRRDLPLLVLGLGRPELHDLFPNLWPGALLETIGLAGLGWRASEQLVHSVLPDIDEATLRRIVELAGGNAFYLEELIRAVAERREEILPETILAMVHAGLARLDPTLRKMIRAASIFGERFTASGVSAIVGDGLPLAACLGDLEEREVISRLRRASVTHDEQFAFRHALLRDAAYETLTAADRSTGHLRAAEWLEQSSAVDPAVMADHLEKGGAAERAVGFLVRAAERAYAAGSPADARRFATRGTGRATGETLGKLKLLDGVSALSQGDLQAAMATLRGAESLLPKGSENWIRAISGVALARTYTGDAAGGSEFVESLQALPVLPIRNPLCALDMARAVGLLSFSGDHCRVRAFVDRIEMELESQQPVNPVSRAWLQQGRAYSFMVNVRGLADVVALTRSSLELFEEARDSLAMPTALCWRGAIDACLGQYESAANMQAEAMARGHASGSLIMPLFAKPLLVLARAMLGNPDSALAELAQQVERSNTLAEGVVQWARGRILLLLDQLDEAESASRAAIASGISIMAFAGAATLAKVLLLQGRPQESLAVAVQCIDYRMQDPCDLSSDAMVTRAESLMALGRSGEARTAVSEARDKVLRVAANLSERDRATYLGSVQSNARTLQLAEEWL